MNTLTKVIGSSATQKSLFTIVVTQWNSAELPEIIRRAWYRILLRMCLVIFGPGFDSFVLRIPDNLDVLSNLQRRVITQVAFVYN